MSALVYFVRGLVIGLSLAASVGPIGVPCIRRPFAGGRAVGLASGLGAATAASVPPPAAIAGRPRSSSGSSSVPSPGGSCCAAASASAALGGNRLSGALIGAVGVAAVLSLLR